MLGKKQIRAIFLFSFKIGHKAAETTHNISNTFGPETANERTVQRWFKKLCKGDEIPGGEQPSGGSSEADPSREQSWKLILLTTTWEIAEEFNIDPSVVVHHLKQAGKAR